MKFKIIGLVAAMFVLPSNVLAATLSLSPASGTINKGCNFPVDIVLDTKGVQTDGTDAILFYDSSRFSINTTSITPNTNVYPDFPGNNVDEAAGRITISGLASVSTPFTGKGTLATLQFTVKDSAPTGSTIIRFDFEPGNPKTTDSNVVQRATANSGVVDILNSVTDGNYVIGTGTCTVTPTPTPTPTVTTLPSTGGVNPAQGAVSSSSQSGQLAPLKTLPPAGSEQFTYTLAIVGSVLTVLGVLGLALL